MNRRLVLKSLLTSTLAGSAGAVLARQSDDDMQGQHGLETVKSKRLKRGDTVGLISPASNALENEGIRFASETIESLGFRVRQGKYLFERNQYLAGTDQQRA
ncbi:MAG: LD-carboxypeptidase, partial [Halioglobus sp.]|nr:LD-carboxypeptidase [Halioglobus sp.]